MENVINSNPVEVLTLLNSGSISKAYIHYSSSWSVGEVSEHAFNLGFSINAEDKGYGVTEITINTKF